MFARLGNSISSPLAALSEPVAGRNLRALRATTISFQDGDKEPEEVSVVVTGFAPEGLDLLSWPVQSINSSWLLTNALPRVIFPEDKPDIRVITYPDAVWTGWEFARKLVPKLWDGEKKTFGMYIDPKKPKTFHIDAMLHLGMLDQPQEAYRLEKYSFKSEYKLPDAGGKDPSEDDKNGGGRWKDIAQKLSTDFHLDSIYKRVSSQTEDAKIVVSEDPNRFLCAYIYFASLAELYNRDEMKRVLFMHISIEHQSKDVERGVGVACRLIEALVDNLEATSTSDEK